MGPDLGLFLGSGPGFEPILSSGPGFGPIFGGFWARIWAYFWGFWARIWVILGQFRVFWARIWAYFWAWIWPILGVMGPDLGLFFGFWAWIWAYIWVLGLDFDQFFNFGPGWANIRPALLLLRASEMGSISNHPSTGQRQDTGSGILWSGHLIRFN